VDVPGIFTRSWIGRAHRLDACWIASHGTFLTDSGIGNTPRVRVTMRISGG
jgi:hypothetical protein